MKDSWGARRWSHYNSVLKVNWMMWQRSMFAFGRELATFFKIDVKTKMHHLVRHVDHHLIHLGCIRRCWYEETEMVHNKFKILYSNSNKHLDDISPQLLKTWIQLPGPSDSITLSPPITTTRSDFTYSSSPYDMTALFQHISLLCGCFPPSVITSRIVSMSFNCFPIWRRVKRVQLCPHLPFFKAKSHTAF